MFFLPQEVSSWENASNFAFPTPNRVCILLGEKTNRSRIEIFLNIENKDGEKIPIGRICTPNEYPNQKNPFNLESIIKRIKSVFEAEKVYYVGDLNKIIKKCCIIGGNNSDIKLMERALEYNCEVRFEFNDDIYMINPDDLGGSVVNKL